MTYANYGDKKLFHYLTCEEGDEKYVADNDRTFLSLSDDLITMTVSDDILKTLRKDGISGKDAYKLLQQKYGTLFVPEKIKLIVKYVEECHDSSKTFDERLATGRCIRDFIFRQPKEEQEPFMQFMLIGQSAKPYMEKFIDMNLPLATSSFDRVTAAHPSLLRGPKVLAATTPTATKNTSDGPDSYTWKNWCFNCFGIGLRKTECSTPVRTISQSLAASRVKLNIRRV